MPLAKGMVTISRKPSYWKIPIPVKVSGLADEDICFSNWNKGSWRRVGRRESRYRGLKGSGD